VIEDVTQERKMREDVVRSREQAEAANRAKSDFLANMSHDLRTPLNSIIGFSDMITSQIYGTEGDPRYFEYAALIHQSGQRLLNLVNDLLDLSRIESGDYDLEERWVDVVKELASAKLRCSPLLDDKKHMIVDVIVDGPQPQLWADAQALSQIIDNLLSNAIKYAGENAKVELIWSIQEDGRGALSVRDNGVGIDLDRFEHILKPFVQAHTADLGNTHVAKRTDGVGLGLHIVSLLAARHDAEVAFDSAMGVGTKATVTFPLERMHT
jgi:signal transduction histidine kinase